MIKVIPPNPLPAKLITGGWILRIQPELNREGTDRLSAAIFELESLFDFRELFFSKTDLRGVILSGNSVFKRVAEYEWNELLHKPHNIVRHPEMPRGVFYLFWKMLASGVPVGAYVKNQSKSGKYYWVFALALPIENGILSIRMKPSSKIFDIAKEEYKKLLEIEKVSHLSPKQSSEKLANRLLELGFPDYNSFMIAALMEELSSRQKKLSKETSPELVNLKDILKLSSQLNLLSLDVIKQVRKNKLLPMNITILSGKLNRAGDPLAVVAEQYGRMTSEILTAFNIFGETLSQIKPAIQNTQFSLCAAVLETEMVKFFLWALDDGAKNAEELHYVPKFSIDDGLTPTIAYFEKLLRSKEKLNR